MSAVYHQLDDFSSDEAEQRDPAAAVARMMARWEDEALLADAPGLRAGEARPGTGLDPGQRALRTGSSGEATAPLSPPWSGALSSPLDDVANMQNAAKWTIAAASVVGIALITAWPVIAVGQVHSYVHAILAGAGLLSALAGVALAIWSSSKVLESRLTTPATLNSPALRGLRDRISHEPAPFLGPFATIEELLKPRAIFASLMRYLIETENLGLLEHSEAQFLDARRQAARAEPYVQFVLAMAHACMMHADLRRSRWHTLIGTVLVVIGSTVFFTATSVH